MSNEREMVAIPDDNWHVVVEGRKCRSKGCPNPAVVKMKRRHNTSAKGWQWWHYCAKPEHMYGRWIENGVVMHEVVAGSPAHKRAASPAERTEPNE